MSHRLIIACAGGLGREVLTYARDAIAAGRLDAEIAGFIDDTNPDLGAFGIREPLLGTIDAYEPGPRDRVVVGVGTPQNRAAVAARLAARGATFMSVIHPMSFVPDTVRMGVGCVVAPFATVGPWVDLGDHVLVNTHAVLGHDCVVGACCELAPHTACNGYVRLGERVFVGSGAVVTARLTIGEDTKVAAGAVVYSDLPAGVTALGNPARIMRTSA
ncbi:NeuD/PglB/VioB family sugar acetyltransferase [Novispirillum sp. DQ9]|uniref:NeuD/PglB/VioB family sugar acetyltransferase n=1 Tax=Novispirillum sp. DQ9 TaxID=3398612 RepID=UPI003C7990DC